MCERATARGMPSATYVSVLVRSHLRNLAPLPKEELLALKRSVAELGAIGRNLNQIARAANQGGKPAGPGREDLKAMLRVAEGLRDHVKALLRANQISGSGTCRDDSLTSEAPEPLLDMPHAAYPAACRVRNYAEMFHGRRSSADFGFSNRWVSATRHSSRLLQRAQKGQQLISGRKRPGRTFGGVVRARAASFKAR